MTRTVRNFANLTALLMAVVLVCLASKVFSDQNLHQSDRLTARLISAHSGIGPETSTLSAGLDIQLHEDWKTYWRSPGEVGLPPSPDWSASENIASVEFKWPAPTRFQAFGIENFGYSKQVVFPLHVTLENAGQPASLAGSVDLLVCAHVCVQETVDLSLNIPAGGGVDFDGAAILATWAEKLPKSDASIQASHYVNSTKDMLVVHISSDQPMIAPTLFPELGDSIFGPPTVKVADARTLVKASYPIFDYVAGPAMVTMTDGNRALELVSTASATALDPPAETVAMTGLWAILSLALLGGLLLNVMPCVLPVLSIKLTSALQAVDRPARQIRAGFLASSLGILSFMWVLAICLIGLRAMGQTIGWGIQFQSPFFLIGIITVLFIFAANMSGAFEITLPHQMNAQMDKTAAKSGLLGDYLTGAFAALMATPCSTPFLGTAVAFALTHSAFVILLVFTALGLGLAAPYLLVALRPSLLRLLPKPGAWMVVLRKVLAGLLVLTAIWLGFVLANTLGGIAAALVFALLGSGILIFSLVKAGSVGRFAILPLLAAFLVPTVIGNDQALAVSSDTVINWQKFDRGQIAQQVAQGQTVFVDITADWCLTCKANKKLVLGKPDVANLLNADGMIAFQADWTRPDPLISQYLQMNNRFGIPFNIVYGPNAPNGIALPELLTKAAVTEALAAAR